MIARAELPFGPVMRARAALLEGRGLIAPGQRYGGIVVVGARRCVERIIARETELSER